MAILKRENKYQGLKDISVLEDERGAESRYFKITDFPNVIPQGKSSFLIAGSKFLKSEVELKLELLDSEGKTIYSEPVPNLLEGNSRRVSIEVYDDTAPGNGFLYIVGELKPNYKSLSEIEANTDDITGQFPTPGGVLPAGTPFGPGGAESNPFSSPFGAIVPGDADDKQDVPSEFVDVYNVRFVKPIFINTTIPNAEPIFFYQEPRLTVVEIVKPYLEQTDEIGTITLSGSLTVNPAPNLPPPPPDVVPSAPGFPTINAANISKIGKGIKKFKKKRKNKINPFQNQNFFKRGRKVRRASPEIDTFTITIDELESSHENEPDVATSAHVGASLTINNPQVNSTEFPTSEFTIPTSFTTTIAAVKNNKTLVPEDDFLITRTATGEKVPAGILLTTATNTTMSFEPLPTASLSTTHTRSFAKVIGANLRTFSGDVFKTKIYGKSQGSLGDFEVIYDGPIESPQVLIDQNSPSGLTSAGYFHNMDVVHNNWRSGSAASTFNLGTTVVRDDEKLLDALLISGSNYQQNQHLTFTTRFAYPLQENVPYTIEFDAYFYKELGINSDGNVEQDFDCEVQISTSAQVIGESTDTFITLGRLNIDNFDNATQGELLGNHVTFVTPSGGDITAKLRIKINQGRLVISDIILRPYSETNFSPDFFEIFIPMPDPLPKKPDFYDFLVEFYDINNNQAEVFLSTENIEFDGAPANIDGDDNLISGSVFLGGARGSGIELFGGSSFIRSVGYNGFVNTIASSSGGFVMFSGSITDRLTSSEAYEGVGLEIVDAHGSVDRYLKFRSNPSTFQVVTDEFFLGAPRTVSPAQFISGSDSKIEISSSNFHLQPDGKLIVGDKANEKYIEWDNSDLTVRGDIAVDSIRTPATIGGTTSTVANASSSIDSQGFAKFASASIAGWEITPDSIQDVNSSGKGIIIQSDPSLPFIDIKEDDNNKIRLFHGSGTNFGLIGTSGSNTIFRLGDTNQIAGWTINNSTIQGGNLILGKEGFVKSADYQSDFAGFIITAEENGYAEFENVKIRGTLATTTFEKESVNAVGGQLFIANSAAMTGSTAPATGSSFSLKNVTGFTKGEILLIKKVSDTGFNTEYVQVVSASRTNAGGDDDPDGLAGNLFVKRGIGYYNRVSASNSSKFGEGNGGLEFVQDSANNGIFRTLTNGDTTNLAYVTSVQDYSSGDQNGFNVSSGHTHSGSFHVYITGSISTVGDGTAVDFKLLNNSNSDSVIGTTRLWSLSDGANFQVERDMFFEHNSLSPSPLGSKIKMQLAVTTDGTDDAHIYLNHFSASLDYGELAGFIGGDSGSVGDPIGSPQDYTEGQVMVSTGRYISGDAPNTVGSGYIRLNANPKNAATPYMDIVERTGSGIYDVELKTRVGDLSGVAGSRNVPEGFNGFGIMSEVAFLSGSNIKLEAPAFALGDLSSNFVSGSNGNIEISSSKFHLSQDGDVTMEGTINATAGQIGGFTLQNGQLTGSATAKIVTQESGRRVEIDGATNSLKFYSGSSGVEVMELSDELQTYVIGPGFGQSLKFPGIQMKSFGALSIERAPVSSHKERNSIGVNVPMPYTVTGGQTNVQVSRSFAAYTMTHPGPISAININGGTTHNTMGTLINITQGGGAGAVGHFTAINQQSGSAAGMQLRMNTATYQGLEAVGAGQSGLSGVTVGIDLAMGLHSQDFPIYQEDPGGFNNLPAADYGYTTAPALTTDKPLTGMQIAAFNVNATASYGVDTLVMDSANSNGPSSLHKTFYGNGTITHGTKNVLLKLSHERGYKGTPQYGDGLNNIALYMSQSSEADSNSDDLAYFGIKAVGYMSHSLSGRTHLQDLIVGGPGLLGVQAEPMQVHVPGINFSNGLSTGEDNSVLILDADKTIKTDEIDSRVWGSTLVDATNGSDGEIAIFTDANSIEGNSDVILDSTTLTAPALKASGGGLVTAGGLRFAPGGTTDLDTLWTAEAADSASLKVGGSVMIDAREGSTTGVSFPNQPSFSARTSADKTASDLGFTGTGTETKTVVFNEERYDVDSDYNVSNGIFTAPLTGKYFLSAHLDVRTIATSVAYFWIQLVTSNQTYWGDLVRLDTIANSTISYFSFDVSVHADMELGDTAQVKLSGNNTGTGWHLNGDSNGLSRFLGHFLG